MFDQFHPCALWSSFGSFDFPQIFNECSSGWCLWMKSREVAEPIEASSLYRDDPFFSFGFGVQFNVGDFLRPVYA